MSPSTDGVIRALLNDSNLKLSVVVCTHAARVGRDRHHLKPVSSALLGQALAAGALIASLQKENSRINLQLECDGPLHGLFVDCDASGGVRGYVKNPNVDLELHGSFRWRAALGNKGYLSVLREAGRGEYYRSSTELAALDLVTDLNHYFEQSDQVPTRVALELRRSDEEALGVVAGVLVQALPDGDVKALEAIAVDLQARLTRAVADQPAPTPASLLHALFPQADLQLMTEIPVAWRCTCSRERVLDMMASLGLAEVQAILDSMGSTAVTCQFCGTKHEVSFHDLVALVEQLSADVPKN
jgi:molecular chaperone Hsp33